MTKLAESYLAIPPKTIISSKELEVFVPGEDLRHIVLFDDASYSGRFFKTFFEELRDKFMYCNPDLMNLQFHLVNPFISEKAQTLFKKYEVTVYHQETLPDFKVPGTKYSAATATYFDHKIPAKHCSTIECIENGKLINGENSGITFVNPVTPPYRK